MIDKNIYTHRVSGWDQVDATEWGRGEVGLEGLGGGGGGGERGGQEEETAVRTLLIG